MKELLVARRALVKDRTAALNRDKMLRSPLLKRLIAQRLRQVERQIEAIDAALRALCVADADLKARLAILVSIPGIGEATALALLIEMPELGFIENKCVASLAGLAPIARDSGQSRGKRSIRGGRAHLRQALYMPALVLYARSGRCSLQCRDERKIPSLHRSRKTTQSRADRNYAKARYPRKCPPPRSAEMDPNLGLTKTDTPVGAGGCPWSRCDQQASTEQIDAGSTVHLALHHFELGISPLSLAVRPWLGEGCLYGRVILNDSRRE
jgi:hypothetical protein